MEKTARPVAAGVLDIVAGVFSIFSFIVVLATLFFVPYYTIYSPGLGPEFGPEVGFRFAQTILLIVAAVLLVSAVLAIIGGVYALQRRKWGLALAGSILAIAGAAPLGIAATVLVAVAKDEFE